MLTRLYLFGLAVYLSLTYLILFLFDHSVIMRLGKEDGFFETFGAICFLITSICFFVLFFQSKRGNNFILFKTKKNLFFLLLALTFFFGFAEEISWGQRIFKFQTPEILEESNIQNEFNIHNLDIFEPEDSFGQRKSEWALMLSSNRLVNLFWAFYCILLPFLNKFSLRFSRWFKKINLPIVPIWLGIFFAANYLMAKTTEKIIRITFVLTNVAIDEFIGIPLTEIKECNLAFLFMIVSFYFFNNVRNAVTQRGLN